MADVWEKDLAQKSSLTTSDFIRVVGSDNVSYKQGVRSVAELMSTALPYSTVTEVLTWAEGINGRGITYTANLTTDLPTEQAIKYGVAWTYNYVGGGSSWLNVFWSPTNRAEIYYNTKTGTNAWLGWQKMPTRAEVDALNSKQQIERLSGVDANTLTETGMYYVYNGTNVPSGYCIVLVFHPVNVSSFAQVGLAMNTGSSVPIYTRKYDSSTQTYTNWAQI